MKIVSILIVATGLFPASFALAAKSPEQTYIESFHGRADMPVPVAVVKPRVPDAFAGRTVVLDFVVDAAGIPRDVRARDVLAPAELTEPLIAAVAQWRFAPLSADGVARPAKVALPVTIVSDWEPQGVVAIR